MAHTPPVDNPPVPVTWHRTVLIIGAVVGFVALLISVAVLATRQRSTDAATSSRPTAQEISAQMGCVAFQSDQNLTELFVREAGDCAFSEDEQDSYPTRIDVFTNTSARDHWLEVATGFGAGPLVVGPTWVIVVDTQCDPSAPCSAEDRAKAIQAKLGGEVR